MKIEELNGLRKIEKRTLPENKTVMSVYVDKTLRDDIKKIAEEENVTIAALHRHILTAFARDYWEES